MDELASVRVQNLQPVITGVRDALNSDHLLNVFNVSARNHSDVHVRVVRQSLQNVLGLRGKGGQIWVGRDRGQRSVVVEQQRKLVIVANVAAKRVGDCSKD